MLMKLSIVCMLLAVAISASPLLAGDLSDDGFTNIQDFSSARRSAPVAAKASAAKAPKASGGLWYDSPDLSDSADDMSMAPAASNYSHDDPSDTSVFEALNSRSSDAAETDAGSSTAEAPKKPNHALETDEVSLAAALEPITIGILILGGMAGVVRRYCKKK
jgi:hypothetical protein